MSNRTQERIYWAFALTACAVLGGAAVWMGGLNQDEGWYLYAANLVSEGNVPYRDFAFTQGPVMPYVYAAFSLVWKTFGLLGARVFTLLIGLLGVVFATRLARRLAPEGAKDAAALVAFFLLATNLYHLYYLAIPKTYALASLFVLAGFWSMGTDGGLAHTAQNKTPRPVWSLFGSLVAGLCFALAAGTRISLGAILPVVGVWLLWRCFRGGPGAHAPASGASPLADLIAFCVGGFGGLAVVYGPFLLSPSLREGLVAAQSYHAARGGFDPTWTVGSLSRLVRWYLPVFLVLGLGSFRHARVLLAAFLAVFCVQMLAPFPYEDYQVPVMALLAVFAASNFFEKSADGAADGRTGKKEEGTGNKFGGKLLLVLGVCYAAAFGSPLLEQWTTNGKDRFWSLKKDRTELAQLRDVAALLESIDPGGKTLLTQDLYLAVEMNRKVPSGLEMGPFSVLTDLEWRNLLTTTECPLAALSGYTFAIEPPKCNERSMALQMDYWNLLKRRYSLVAREESFGQGATPLLILMRKEDAK